MDCSIVYSNYNHSFIKFNKMVLKILKIVLYLFIFNINVAYSQFSGWISPSAIWGQGSAGISFRTNQVDFIAYSSLVLKDSNINYSENTFAIKNNIIWTGLRLRSNHTNHTQWEQAPFIAIHNEYKTKFPISIHNELEYRNNPYLIDENYIRYNLVASIFYKERIFDFTRPYISNKIFFNLDNGEFEKDLFMTGLDFYIEKAKIRIYYIPKVWGDIERSWDENNRWGAVFIWRL